MLPFGPAQPTELDTAATPADAALMAKILDRAAADADRIAARVVQAPTPASAGLSVSAPADAPASVQPTTIDGEPVAQDDDAPELSEQDAADVAKLTAP